MHISRDGIRMVPRLEETVHPSPDFAPSNERAEFGLEELDTLLQGGLPEKSATMLAGSYVASSPS